MIGQNKTTLSIPLCQISQDEQPITSFEETHEIYSDRHQMCQQFKLPNGRNYKIQTSQMTNKYPKKRVSVLKGGADRLNQSVH